MKKRILEYRNYIDELLEKPPEDTDWEKIREEHLVQIGFFQHERLIHLIVTVTFALLEIISIFMALMLPQVFTFLLAAAIFVLLAPYINHYYLLENETQKMYYQYDKIVKIIDKGDN